MYFNERVCSLYMGAFDTIAARLQNNAYVNQDALLAQTGNQEAQFQIKSEWHDTQAKIAYFKEACQVFIAKIQNAFGANIALDVIKQTQNLANFHEQWMNSTSVFEFERKNQKFDAALSKLEEECKKIGATFNRVDDQLLIRLPDDKELIKFTIPTPDKEYKLQLQHDILNKVVNEQHQQVGSNPDKKLYTYQINDIADNIAKVDVAKKQLTQIEDRKLQQQVQPGGASLKEKLMSASSASSAESPQISQWLSHWRHDYRHQHEYEIHQQLYQASHSVLKLEELINKHIEGVNKQYTLTLEHVDGDVVPFFVNNETGEAAQYASFKEVTTPYYEHFYFKEAFKAAKICYNTDKDLFKKFGETVTPIALSAEQEPFSAAVLAQLREDFMSWKQESHFSLSALKHSPVLDIPKQAETLIQEQTTFKDAELMSIFIDLKMRKTFKAAENQANIVERCIRNSFSAKNEDAKLVAQEKYQVELLKLRVFGKVIALDSGVMAKQQDPQDNRSWGISHRFALSKVANMQVDPNTKLDLMTDYLRERVNSQPTDDRFLTFLRFRGPDLSLFNSIVGIWLNTSTSTDSIERLYNTIEEHLPVKEKQVMFYFAAEKLYRYAEGKDIQLPQPSDRHLTMIQNGYTKVDDFIENNGIPKEQLYKGHIPNNLIKK